ncbi:MAG: hypothetical protein ACFFCW_44200, partial [Candidatus Hodarchaeota archaeon]
EEKAPNIELILWEELDMSNWKILDLKVPAEKLNEKTPITTEPFMVISVPPSPKGDALFFRPQLVGYFKKAISEYRQASCHLDMNIVSDLIPSNIEVLILIGLYQLNEHNLGGSYDLSRIPVHREPKVMLKRNKVGWWNVVYKTGGRVPEQEAIPIINDLIENGFEVEIYYDGYIQGIEQVVLGPFWIEVTRVSEN